MRFPFRAALCLALAWPAACSGGGPVQSQPESGAESAADHERDLRDLISAVSPLAPTATALQERDWYLRRREIFERLRRGSHAFGVKALEQYRQRAESSREVRAALLDVAAHAAPEEARPLLVELTTTFGEDLGLRKTAVELLGKTAPESAIEILEPLLMAQQASATYPPADALLGAYVEAMEREGRDPTAVLAFLATDMRQVDAARNLALRELGKRPSPSGRQALEAVLVESLGDNLARRYAVQALEATLTEEELCPLLQRIFDNEADIGFQQFLASMLEERCL